MYSRPPVLPPRTQQSINDMSNQFAAMNTQQDDVHVADIFNQDISTDAPLPTFARTTHEVTPKNVSSSGKPIATNKFYSNFMLGDQTLPTWVQPCSVWWSKDLGYEGLAMHHVQANDIVSGPDSNRNPVQFFFGPNGIRSLILGSEDFNNSTTLHVENPKHMSANIKIQSKDHGYMLVPLVQGAGFVTGIYYNLIPKLKSAVGFASVTGYTSPRSGINKYKITLNNNRVWTLYITIPNGQSLTLAKKDGNTIVASNSVNGCVFQIVPTDFNSFDHAAGAYPTGASISGSVSGTSGTYTINYSIAGSSNSGNTALFALPHHVASFTSSMNSAKTNLVLQTVTKGKATGYITNKFESSVVIPSNVGLDPFSTIPGVYVSYSDAVLNKIREAARADVSRDVANESNLDSMYFGGKKLAMFAWVLYVTHYVLKDNDLTGALLPKIKAAIERFSNNRQAFPLAYDQTWKGIVSTAPSGGDFGNSYYNDHHFHYGYHVFACAIAAKVDKELGGSWINSVKNWVNNLARDFSSPKDDDQFFPAYRSFDWYSGHSWAKGVYASGDGKDQESTSEDYNALYALKIWGSVVGDSALEDRSNIQLGVLRVSLNKYFLLADNNDIQPSNFIKNKVTGILFENKCDHTTYFGTNPEYIQMIHAIPITSISSFFRTPTFVREEWDQVMRPVAESISTGWKGISYLNLALTDPNSAYDFFASSNFRDQYLDDGQTRTWSLTYCGALANR